MRAYLFVAAALASSAVADATPLYLLCPVATADGKSAADLDVTLDEGAGTAGVHVKKIDQSWLGIRATFTPDEVRWERGSKSSHMTYQIDRKTLELVEVLYIGETAYFTRKGICTHAATR